LIRINGIRNCALLTIAPTGTTALVSEVTSGIEPMYGPAYTMTYYIDAEKTKAKKVVVHPLFKKFIDEGKNVDHFQGAFDITLRDHFEVQRVCQRHLDNACSKTINVPAGTSEDELSDLFMEFFPDLKGVTIYPDGSREDQPLQHMSLEEAIACAKTATSVEAGTKVACKGGSCDI
jgi:ribonucleoside-diphosphate reductase alpha chain